MSTTARSKSDIPIGASTEPTPDALSQSVLSRIALAMLKQAVLDLAGKDLKLRAQSAHWLNSPGAKEVCEVLSVDYKDMWEDIRDITFRPSAAQRIYMARTLIKSFPKL